MPERVRRWLVRGVIAAAVIWLLALYFSTPGLIPRVLGTGGFVTATIRDAPHPYAFDAPRLWENASDELHRSGEKWDASIIGPGTDMGVFSTSIHVYVRPAPPREAEYPLPARPFASLDDFVDRMLPSASHPLDYKLIRETTTTVDGRPARDLLFDYLRFGVGVPPPGQRGTSVPARGRAVFFEDRGYYYNLGYDSRGAEYDRYSEVFERMLASFRFLD